MNQLPSFDPRRSAAIRDLLIENVETEPRRHRRHLRALLTGLIITGVLASGTTALALNRETLFGASTETPSTSVPPTTSVASTPNTTPTPDAPPPVTVGTSPIAPHDVTAAPASGSWSRPLPAPAGMCLVDTATTNVSEGLALVSVGPSFADDTPIPDGCDLSADGLSLSLVNTQSGELLWSREWSWTLAADSPTGHKAMTLLLDDSNQILVASRPDLNGPNEIVDLGTGETIAPFVPNENGETMTAMYEAPDDSGDVYAIFGNTDENGSALPHFDLRRFNPLNPTVAVWSTPLDANDLQLDAPRNHMRYAMVQYTSATTGIAAFALLDISTGELSPRDSYTHYKYFTGYTIRPSSFDDPVGTPVTLTGLDDSGEQLWTRTELPGGSATEVLTANARPGQRAGTQVGNGQFVIASPQSLILVDGTSGETVWSANPTACGLSYGASQTYNATLSSDGSAITVDSSAGSCRFDAASGAQLADTPIPWNMFRAYGKSLVYYVADGAGTAYDSGSGEAIWSTATNSYSWFYAGGYLVALDGTTLRSIG